MSCSTWRPSASSGSRSSSSSTSWRSTGSEIGVALLIQYLGPLFVALFAFFVLKEHVRGRIWIALGARARGLTLVVDLWHGVSLDGLGVLFSLCSAVTFAGYLLLAERAVGRRDPISLLCFGIPLRRAVLGDRAAVVELPVRRACEVGVAARPPRPTCTCRSGC